jgi:hypothetical protein
VNVGTYLNTYNNVGLNRMRELKGAGSSRGIICI